MMQMMCCNRLVKKEGLGGTGEPFRCAWREKVFHNNAMNLG